MAEKINEAKTVGRFRYIEPNNLQLDLSDNAITFPYEDYSMGVRLEVSVPDRFSCGMGSGNTIVMTSENGTLEFFGGTGSEKGKQGYLTTSFTDISVNNVDRGNKECLGIESINISYQQWFYPIVNIKFVDVRGASLFMPQEKALQATIAKESNKNRNITQIDGGSFFKAIFACPSPIFKLTIMGFYGKSVTYNLKMSNFQSDFDSENGNFIANVDFVGNMYGVYTEIPLQYLAVAPYLNMNYWDANADGKFAFKSKNTTSRMLTFPEFWKKVEQIEIDADKYLENKRKEIGYSILTEKERQLNIIKDLFLNGAFNKWSSYNSNNEVYYYKVSESANGDDCIYLNQIKTFYNNIISYNEKYEANLPTTEFEVVGDTDNEQQQYYVKKYSKYFVENGIIYDVDGNKHLLSSIEDQAYNGAGLKLNTRNNKQYIYEFKSELLNLVNESLTNIEKDKKEINEKLEVFKVQEMNELLGFDLNIGNIFKMIFAHLDAFITEYYNTLSNISKEKSNRTFTKLNVNYDDTDIPNNIKELPPYPLIFGKSHDGTDKNEVQWLGDVVNNPVLDETILVEKILAASHNYMSAMTEAQNEINMYRPEGERDLNPSTDMMVPLTMYDFLTNDGYKNPYSEAANETNYEFAVEKIKTIFALRCLYAIYIYGDKSFWAKNRSCIQTEETINYIASVEAINIRKAFGPNMDFDIMTGLGFSGGVGNYSTTAAKDFINYLSNNTGYWQTLGNDSFIKRINDKKDAEYSLIKDGDDLILPLKYNVDNIKQDIVNNKINESSEYLHTDSSKNVDTFIIKLSQEEGSNNEDFLLRFKNKVIETSENYTTDLQKPEVDSFFSKFGDIENPEKFYKKGYNIYRIEENKDKKKWDYTDITNERKNKDFEKCIAVQTKLNNKLSENNLYNVVTYGTVDTASNGNFGIRQGVFQTDFYKCQSNDIAKAYCFVFSNALESEGVNTVYRKQNIGKVPYFLLLQEGAYYWRKENQTEVSYILDGKTYNPQLKDNVELIPVYFNSFNKFISTTNESINFIKWGDFYGNGGDTNVSEGRKKRLIQLFIDFANSKDFQTLKNYLEQSDSLIDKSDSKVLEMQRIFLNIMEKWIFIIDYSIRADDRPIKKIFDITDLESLYTKLIEELSKIYDKDYLKEDAADKITGNQLEIDTGLINDKHLKISTYLILKDLYDKYFSNMTRNRLILDTKESEFDKFLFLDSYYNDISEKLMVNSSFITDLIKSITYNSSDAFNVPTKVEKSISVFEFMSEVCQNCGMTFLALPQKFSVSSPRYLEDMFTPHQYKDLDDNENDGCYIALYSYKPSQFLDIASEQYAYKNDSFDITDGLSYESAIPSALGNFKLTDKKTFDAIPAFGVTYAKQNQSIFKKVNLTTSNQQITEQSIFATFDVAAKANQGPRESTLYGQDLYRVYSSYAYQCTVEMMGNIQIMPLMYFQLNNIAMWHGAYMIISVEHNLVPGDMVTRFTGVRVNKNAIPLVDADIIFIDSDGIQREINGPIDLNDNITYGIDTSRPTTDRETAIIQHIKKWEGGYADIPEDRGGCTMSGITIGVFKDTYPGSTCEDLRNISNEQWLKIFREKFYYPGKIADVKNDSIALLLIDTFFNMGIGHRTTFAKLFGMTLKGKNCTTSEWYETVKIINNTDDEEAFAKIWNWRKNRYYGIVRQTPSQQKFLKGWLNRLQSVKFRKTDSLA